MTPRCFQSSFSCSHWSIDLPYTTIKFDIARFFFVFFFFIHISSWEYVWLMTIDYKVRLLSKELISSVVVLKVGLGLKATVWFILESNKYLLGLVSILIKEDFYFMINQDHDCRDISVLYNCLIPSVFKWWFLWDKCHLENLMLAKKKRIVLYCVSWTVKHGKVHFSFLGFVYICCSYNTK